MVRWFGRWRRGRRQDETWVRTRERWGGIVNRIQYRVIFAALDDEQVDREARALVDDPFARSDRDEDHALLADALAHPDELRAFLDRWRLASGHPVGELVGYLDRVHARMDALRPWPVHPFMLLDAARRWPAYRADPCRIGVLSRVPAVVDPLGYWARVADGPPGGERDVLVVRLSSGDEIAFVGREPVELRGHPAGRSAGEVLAALEVNLPLSPGELRRDG